jgi:hypothetical protein
VQELHLAVVPGRVDVEIDARIDREQRIGRGDEILERGVALLVGERDERDRVGRERVPQSAADAARLVALFREAAEVVLEEAQLEIAVAQLAVAVLAWTLVSGVTSNCANAVATSSSCSLLGRKPSVQ